MERDLHTTHRTRRGFLHDGLVFAASGLAMSTVAQGAGPKEVEAQERVTPNEDLMQEHGLLNRVLIIYEEAIRRLTAGEELPLEAVRNGAKVVREYIEDYHEKLEQDFLFPRFINANLHPELVQVLLEQHLGGRNLTDITLHLTTQQMVPNANDRQRLMDSLRRFVHMYHAHEAREDTVLFPQFRTLVSPHEYSALREDFAKREREQFGGESFPKMVERVTAIETQLGIHELARFTEGF